MDELDRKILDDLLTFGYQKSKAMAKRLNIGDRTIRRRINKMKENGDLRIVVVPNPVSLGYTSWAIIGIKVSPSDSEKVSRAFVEHPAVHFVASSFGSFDLLIGVFFQHFLELARFVNLELVNMKGILFSETMNLITPRRYWNFSWPRPNFNFSQTVPSKESNGMDLYSTIGSIDRDIIEVLINDGFVSSSELQSKLRLAPVTIRKHMKDMQDKGLFRIEVAPNPSILGYDTWAIIGVNISQRSTHATIEDILLNRNIYLASSAIGRFNAVIAAKFRNAESFNEYLKSELANIQGVSNMHFFMHTKPYKYHNVKWAYRD